MIQELTMCYKGVSGIIKCGDGVHFHFILKNYNKAKENQKEKVGEEKENQSLQFRISALVTFDLSFILEMTVCFISHVLIQKQHYLVGEVGGGRDLPSSLIQRIFDSLLGACRFALYCIPSALDFFLFFLFCMANSFIL